MMKKFTLTIFAAAVLGLTGCATNLVRTDAENSARAVQIEPDLHTVSRGDAEDADEVSLPQNYNPDNYRKMVLQVLFYPDDQENPDRFAKEKSEAVTSLFETEITKLRRFTILSSSQLGQQARRDVKRMQDKGGVPSDRIFRLGREKGAKYALVGGIAIKSERYNRLSNNEIFYIITVNYQLINLETNEIEEADTAEGRAKRTFYATPNGAYVGGFNLNDPKQTQVALNEASYRALKIIANKIGNKFPVGGQVTGARGERVQVNAGYDQGLMGKQVGVLYTFDGVDIPLAYVELQPGKNSTSGRIIRWNSDDEADELIDKFKENGMAYLRDYPETYVVSKGMPTPPEWDKNYKN